MRLVHLSDIHLSIDNVKQFHQYYLAAIVEDLKQINAEKIIDAVCITGDLIDKGGSSFETEDKYEFFFKNFSLVSFTEEYEFPGAEQINGDIYPTYMRMHSFFLKIVFS